MSTPDHTEVDTLALDRFSYRTRYLGDRFEALADAMARISVGGLAFGQLPASRGLHDGYELIAEACRDGLADGCTAMQDVATGVRSMGESYDAAEVANHDLFNLEGPR